jgi:putative alpha-1,2-mannosidase
MEIELAGILPATNMSSWFVYASLNLFSPSDLNSDFAAD